MGVLDSFKSYFFAKPQVPRAESVLIKYGNKEYKLKFDEDDFANEPNPRDGITVKTLKFLVSRELTPLILDASPIKKRETVQGAIKTSTLMNPENFTITYRGVDLADNDKTLKDYGVTEGARLDVFVKDFMKAASAAAATDRTKNLTREEITSAEKRNAKKKGKNAKANKKKGSAASKNKSKIEQPDLSFDKPILGGNAKSVMSQIPKGFPKKPPTEREKVDKIMEEVDSTILPLIKKFTENTPEDPQKRLEDHRIITESLLQKMLLLDGIDTLAEDEGEKDYNESASHEETLRQYRKNAVNKMHKYLADADEIYKAKNKEQGITE